MCVCVCVCVFSVTLLSPFISKSCKTRWGSQRSSRDCSGVLGVASLEETQGLLSRFDRVYSGYITQGCAGGALAGGYEPTCQMLLFSYTHSHHGTGTAIKAWNRLEYSHHGTGTACARETTGTVCESLSFYKYKKYTRLHLERRVRAVHCQRSRFGGLKRLVARRGERTPTKALTTEGHKARACFVNHFMKIPPETIFSLHARALEVVKAAPPPPLMFDPRRRVIERE